MSKTFYDEWLPAVIESYDKTPVKSAALERARTAFDLRMEGADDNSIIQYIIASGQADSTYDLARLNRDVRRGLKEYLSDQKELTQKYLVNELSSLDREEKRVDSIIDIIIDRMLEKDTNGNRIDVKDFAKLVLEMNRTMRTKLAIKERRAKHLPLDAPKQVKVQSANLNFTLDDFLAVKREMVGDESATLDIDIIEQ